MRELTFPRPGVVEAVLAPIRAIDAEGEARFVWVVDRSKEPHRVKRHAVRVGTAVGEQLPIIEGLEPGSTIVGAGIAGLAEGMPVRRWERANSPAQ